MKRYILAALALAGAIAAALPAGHADAGGMQRHLSGATPRVAAPAGSNRGWYLHPNASADAQTYYNQGMARYQHNDYRGAIADFTQAVRLDPHLTQAFHQRARARFLLKDYRGALADFSQTVRLDPHDAKAFEGKCLAHIMLGDDRDAVLDCSRALSLVPTYAHAFRYRALARYHLKDYYGAIADYSSDISLDPADAGAYYSRGLARIALGDRRGAAADWHSAQSLAARQGDKAVDSEARNALSALEHGNTHSKPRQHPKHRR